MDETIAAPTLSSVTPSFPSTARCPAAVAPPWLPMQGAMKGSPPAARTAATAARSTAGRSAMPLLPAVIPTRAPRVTRSVQTDALQPLRDLSRRRPPMPPGGTAGPRVAEGGSRASNWSSHTSSAASSPSLPRATPTQRKRKHVLSRMRQRRRQRQVLPRVRCGPGRRAGRPERQDRRGQGRQAGRRCGRREDGSRHHGRPQAPLAGRHLGRLRRPRHRRDRHRRHGLRRLRRRRAQRRHRRQRQRRPRPGRRPPIRAAATRSSSPAPTTSTTRATARSRTRTSSRAAPTSPPPPRSMRRRGRSRPPSPASARTTRSRCSTAATSPAPRAQIDAVLKANPDFQKAWLNKGIFLSHEGRIASRAATRRPPRSCSPRRRPRSPRPSPSTPSPTPGSRPTRACSSCSSSSRLLRVSGRRAGTPAGGREPLRREGAALRSVGGTWRAGSGTAWPRRPQRHELRNGAATARALGREPPRAASAPRAPRDPRCCS